MAQPTFLDGYPALADAVRIFIITVGFTLAMIALKIAVRAAFEKEWDRVYGSASFALIIATPAVGNLFLFNQPLNAYTTPVYLLGLMLGIVAFGFRVTMRYAWYANWRAAHPRHRTDDRR